VAEHADAAMFDLAKHGFKTVFQQLVACIISIRTLTSFRGVGPKCANLTMGVACGAERISARQLMTVRPGAGLSRSRRAPPAPGPKQKAADALSVR
jgi:hypothetical protein